MAKKKALTQKPNKVIFLLDESGSMKDTEDITMSGFNEYIEGLVLSKKNVEFTLVLFNENHVNTLYKNVPIASVPKLTNKQYKPLAQTPLYDAIGKTITDIQADVATGEEVLMVIFTDGLENHSREYTKKGIMKLIADKEAENWLFTYMGANQNSWASAEGIGISNAKKNAKNYEPIDAGVAFASLGQDTANYLSNPEESRRRGFFAK